MVICRFFQQGRCKFGENCRNEHNFLPQDGSLGTFSQQSHQDREAGGFGPQVAAQQKHFSQMHQPQRPQTYFPQAQQPQRFFQSGALAAQPRLFSQNYQPHQSYQNPSMQYGVHGLPVTIQFSALSQQRTPASRPENGGQGVPIRTHMNVVRTEDGKVICRFFQEGRCKFGANCRKEHCSPQGQSRNSDADRNPRTFNQ